MFRFRFLSPFAFLLLPEDGSQSRPASIVRRVHSQILMARKIADTKRSISLHIIHDSEYVFPSIQYFVVSISLSFYLLDRMIVALSNDFVYIAGNNQYSLIG